MNKLNDTCSMSKRLTCKICGDKEVQMVFIPCGHAVSCVSCSQSVVICIICRAPINARVKFFLTSNFPELAELN
ncbi:unnamed protein product [Psylliodes chrysocephalus]|uniref:RING-type domain-containing protein n=1 Tax=Psylliodes chrysocephalus TaxID=3402493 RepID=A0A9P0GC93_9CUCU|nr:unnamed protein product [Psylliodes chrysocephala]